ncbi:MAG: N-acetyltransferase [Oscillospiraceae bacterium]|nr:N-acetyltransferase [Oscillospiraceae bacterium]
MSIRKVTLKDVPAMLEIYRAFVENTAVSFEYETPTVEAFSRRVEEHLAFYPWLVWEEQGTVLGYAYAGRAFERAAYAWNAEISCYLAPEIRGKGIGRQLYGEIERILLSQGVRKVFAVVTSANAPSVAFHEALGYKKTAVFPAVGYKLGQWHDVIWLEKQLMPLGEPERFPQPWL